MHPFHEAAPRGGNLAGLHLYHDPGLTARQPFARAPEPAGAEPVGGGV